MRSSSMPPLDNEGYLVDLNTWDQDVACSLASNEGIALTDAHWQIITILRAFYEETQTSPAMRALVTLVKKRLGTDCGSSVYLMQLFGGSPAKSAAKIAGLPRPTNCL